MEVKVMVRYIILVLAIVNQWLANKGLSPIPVDEESISTMILTAIGLYTAWKNNPVSKEAKWANQKMKKYKAEKKFANATGQLPVGYTVDPTDLNELKAD